MFRNFLELLGSKLSVVNLIYDANGFQSMLHGIPELHQRLQVVPQSKIFFQ